MVPPLVIANAPLALSVPEPLMLPMVPLATVSVPSTLAALLTEMEPPTFSDPALTVRLLPVNPPIEEVVAEEL